MRPAQNDSVYVTPDENGSMGLTAVRATRVGCRLSGVLFRTDGVAFRILLDVEGRAVVRCGRETHVVLLGESRRSAPPTRTTDSYRFTITARRRGEVLTGIRIARRDIVVADVRFDPRGAVLRSGDDVVVVTVPESPTLSVLEAGGSRYAAVVLRPDLPDVVRAGDVEGSVVILDGLGEFVLDGDRLVVAGDRVRVGKGHRTYGAGDEITIGGKRAVIHYTADHIAA